MATVMVIDDEDVLVELIASIVEDLGHIPIIANDGHQAYEMLRSALAPPALVLSDVMMPRMNGIELTAAIKNDARLQRVPVVLMSAAGLPSGHRADQFVHKPFDIDVLSNIILSYLRA